VRTIVLQFAAQANASWVCDRDQLLQHVSTTGGNAVVSEDPAMTAATFKAPSALTQFDRAYVYATADAGTGQMQPPFQLKIPISAGKKVYVDASGQGSVTLWLDDPVPAD
jgi:hypothetical protein